MRQVALVLDFDGTVMREDVGNAICDQFAPSTWRDVNDRYLAGRLSIFEAQEQMWGLVSATETQIVSFLKTLQRRHGFRGLLARATAVSAPVVIASGGFEWYIRRLLHAELPLIHTIFANTLHFEHEYRLRPEFPHLGILGCERCAICKAKILHNLRRSLGPHGEIVFVGDGASDQCAVMHADRVYTVKDSHLERYCREHDIMHESFESFDSVDLR
jgi:2,3-diketo-5-methylthio-1-phosphopentane phosphatase